MGNKEIPRGNDGNTWVIMDDPFSPVTSSPEDLAKLLEWWKGMPESKYHYSNIEGIKSEDFLAQGKEESDGKS